MPGSRRKVLGHVMSNISAKMNRTKKLGPDLMDTPLNRCLSTFDITLIGIGHMVGAGIYVLTGTVSKDIAGPGIILSFLLAGFTSILAALCYAEFGTRIPKAGSAYVYTYISIGEFWAFIIGWNIILEHMIGAASVARAWSGYVDSLFGGQIGNFTVATFGEMHEQLLSKYPDFLAFTVCLVYACVLGVGVKSSAILNAVFTMVNMAVIVFVIGVGFFYAKVENWTEGRGFLPFGFSGVIAGAATCFYAFVGFDSIATSGEEARNPSASIPFAMMVSMGVATLGYVLVSAALTLMVPYWSINPAAALPEAFVSVGLTWAKYVVSLGALCGMTTTLFGSLFSLPRCMYAMASDGLLFGFLATVNKKTQVPLANLAVSGLSSGLIALVFDIEKLVEFMSIGTLLAYTIVSASVIILRYRPPTPEEVAILGVGVLTDDSSLSGGELSSPSSEILEFISAGTLRPGFARVGRLLLGDLRPGTAVGVAVLAFTFFSIALCAQVAFCADRLHAGPAWWPILVVAFFAICLAVCLLVISAHQQNTTGLRFKVPLVPFIPALSIFLNIELMVNLNALTWVRFIVWMALGMLVYFLYGIHHSKESDPSSSYAVLLRSPEAEKNKFGTIQSSDSQTPSTSQDKTTFPVEPAKEISTSDRRPIINEEEIPQ